MFDGVYYKLCKLTKKLLPTDVTFTWNTDGVPLFKSSKTSMWPLYLGINELPYELRRQPDNLLLIGLWIGPKKPEMMTFLDPFIESFKTLEKGIHVTLNDSGEACTLRGFLISGTADLPAKCVVHNMTQFNGKYSCPACKQPGETATAGKGVSHIYPFNFEGPTEPRRSHAESIEFSETASQTSKPIFGIKGPCWFTQLELYDFVKSNCIDYMHCVLLGITKRLIVLLFSKENASKPYSMRKHEGELNARINKLKPPLFIKRAPRPISELKYWKASELKSFLLYYGPVILCDILTDAYYSHFLLLSEAIYILLKDSISQSDVEYAENLLEEFVIIFPGLYESRYLTLNFHLLLHLPENVRQLGPIWGYSCFPYEDANGFLMKLVKGTQSVHSQLIDSMAITQGLPYLEKQCIQPGSRASDLLRNMKYKSFRKCVR